MNSRQNANYQCKFKSNNLAESSKLDVRKRKMAQSSP